jgi:hypothetical protein
VSVASRSSLRGNPRSSPQWVAFDAGLRELGYVEGQKLETALNGLILA